MIPVVSNVSHKPRIKLLQNTMVHPLGDIAGDVAANQRATFFTQRNWDFHGILMGSKMVV